MSRVIAIVQARTGSTRLPEKVLLDISGRPMLCHDIERLQRARKINEIVVATTDLDADNKIVDLCKQEEWHYFRGSCDDVLDRYYQAARHFKGEVIVRITSDCPLIDPDIVDKVIEAFFITGKKVDYSSNIYPNRTFPRGLDTEVIGYSALEKSWKKETRPELREHVTQYIIRHPHEFTITGIENADNFSHLRWTVDTPQDLVFVREVYRHFPDNNFSWKDVIHLHEKRPELSLINSTIQQKEIV
jgi:spore coat polysaccharide biosynthesis protein SpsF